MPFLCRSNGFEPGQPLDLAADPVALAHDGLRRVRVGPERGVLDAGVQLLQAGRGDIPVKDASSAGTPMR